MANTKGHRVAVIVPFSNGQQWIESAVEIVVEQTIGPGFEFSGRQQQIEN